MDIDEHCWEVIFMKLRGIIFTIMAVLVLGVMTGCEPQPDPGPEDPMEEPVEPF